MRKILPKAKVVDVLIPKGTNADLYQAGFEHSISGGQITKREHLKASFRLGFRNARLYIRELRKKERVIRFPARWNFKLKI